MCDIMNSQNSIQKAGKTVGMGRMVEGRRKGKEKGERRSGNEKVKGEEEIKR